MIDDDDFYEDFSNLKWRVDKLEDFVGISSDIRQASLISRVLELEEQIKQLKNSL